MRRSRIVLLPVTLLALIVSGCGGGGDIPGEDAAQRVVRIGLTTEGGGNYDPVTNPNAFAFGYLSPVFDTLLTTDDAGGLAEGLATSWEATDDGGAVTLTLRDGVTFHDGAVLDAAAVVANLDRARSAQDSVLKGELATVTALTAVDDLTVEVELSGGAGAFLGSLTGRVGMMGSPEALTDPGFANAPVGAGPWEVSDESVVGQTMVYTAYADYWDPDVQTVDRIELTLVAAESMHSALLGSQIDIGTVEARRDQVPQLERAGFTLLEPTVPYQHLLYLAKSGPLADERVRQAVSLGLDRQSIADDVLDGACTPQAALQALPGADDVTTPEQDLDAARDLLAEAGYADGVDISIVVSSAGPGSTILQAMQGQLAEIGIRLTINPLARAQLLSTYVSGGADGYFTVNTGDAYPAPLVAQVTSTLNPGGLRDEQLDQLAAEGAAALDEAARTTAYEEWNARFAEVAFAIGLCNLTLPYMVAEGIDGLQVGRPLHIDPRGLTVG